jgi:2-desacetyl-2-hydroxyethyl bacteriochlorophyllide A dehydrogenase
MSIPKQTARIVFTAKERAELQEAPLKPVGPGDVLVRNTWTMISTGTETTVYGARFDSGTHWDRWVKWPFSPGYCSAGVVEAVGANVRLFKPGDRVAGREHHMKYAVSAEAEVRSIPDGVTERDAAWLAIGLIVQFGVRRCAHEMGDDVAVIGLGPLGQLTVQFARAMGAHRIIAIDPVASRLELAKQNGATHAVALGVDEALSVVKDIVGERLCDTVYDVTGSDRVFAGAQQLLRAMGKLVLIGDAGSPAGQRLTPAVLTRNLNVIGTYASAAPEMDSVWNHWTRPNMDALFFQYLKDGRIRTSSLNSHIFSPAEAQNVYQRLLHERSSTMACHFDWSKI